MVDENTHQYCLPIFLNELNNLKQFEILEMPTGEENKILSIAEQLWMALSDLNCDRNALLINLGGGVVSDMGGFIASTYKRGINFVNIPTTLLAMVDASIGGKNGIDLNGIKNVVGTINLPQLVCVFPDFLKTLSKREFMNGMAEVFKHALIADAAYWNILVKCNIEKLSTEELANIVDTSVAIKSLIVKQDLNETGLRKTLNYGHTVGHAIEAFFLQNGKSVLHGEAVIEGILIENTIAVKKGILNKKEADVIKKELRKYYKTLSYKLSDISSIINFMIHDKKNRSSSINLALISAIGSCNEKVECTKEEIHEALQNYLLA